MTCSIKSCGMAPVAMWPSQDARERYSSFYTFPCDAPYYYCEAHFATFPASMHRDFVKLEPDAILDAEIIQ